MTSNGSGSAHCYRHRDQELDVPPRIIARCSTASFGSFGPVHLGRTYPLSMVLANGCQPLLSLATSRDMAAYAANPTTASACAWTTRLGPALCRFHDYSGSSARSRSKREQKHQTLGRSRGGFSSKVHVRAEGLGKTHELYADSCPTA